MCRSLIILFVATLSLSLHCITTQSITIYHGIPMFCAAGHFIASSLQELLGNRYADFDKLSIEKTAYVLGSELWEYDLTIYSA